MTERLDSADPTGAEDLNALLTAIYTPLLDVLDNQGGDVVQFGGDALAAWFEGSGHRARAIDAGRATLATLARLPPVNTPAGVVQPVMTAGLASGDVFACLVGHGHRDLALAGPVVSAALTAEAVAGAWELRTSPASRSDASVPSDNLAERPPANLRQPELCATTEHRQWVAPDIAALLVDGALPGEHRNAAAAFVRLGGTDALVTAQRDDKLATALARATGVVEEAAAQEGVVWTGTDVGVDSVVLLLHAGAVKATEHDPERLLRALHAVLDEAPQAAPEFVVRAGGHLGRVFAGVVGGVRRRAWAALGRTTNVAARLTAAAAPGAALVSADLLSAAGKEPEGKTRELRLKGVARALDAVELRPGSSERLPRRAASPEPPLVSRETEVGELQRALAGVARGESGAVLLLGPAGVGKSRVLAEALRAAGLPGASGTLEPAGALWAAGTTLMAGTSSTVRVVEARASAYDTDSAYLAVRPGLQSLLGTAPERWAAAAGEDHEFVPLLGLPLGVRIPASDVTRHMAPEFVQATRNRLLARLVRQLSDTPMLVIAEDGQYLDPASLALLDTLAADPPAAGFLAVVALRQSPEAGRWPASDRWRRVVLDPLSRREARRLVLVVAGERPLDDIRLDDVLDAAAGNPLFLRELTALALSGGGALEDRVARAGERGRREPVLPRSVEAVIAANIDTLPLLLRRRLRESAVAGREVGLPVLSDALDDPTLRDPRAWQNLSEFVELVTEPTVRQTTAGEPITAVLRFRHDLVRQVAYAGLPLARRRVVHGALVDVLRGRHAPASVLAIHAAAAGRFSEAAAHSLVAAEAAAGEGSWTDALRSFVRARECGLAAEKGEAWLADVAERVGTAADVVGRFDEAEQAFAEAVRWASGRDRVRRLVGQATAVERQGRFVEALKLLDVAEAGERRDVWGPGRVAVALRRLIVLHRLERYEEALELSRELAEADGIDPVSRARALLRLEMNASDLDLPQHREYGRQALAAFEGLPIEREFGSLLLNLGTTAHADLDWELAGQHWSAAEEVYRRTGDVSGAALAAQNVGELLTDQGHYEQARTAFEECRRVLRAAGHAYGAANADSGLGRVLGFIGEGDYGRELLTASAATFAELGLSRSRAEALVRLAELETVEGTRDAPAAVQRADQALEALNSATDPTLDRLRYGLERARALVARGSSEPEQVVSRLRHAAEKARAAGAHYEDGSCLDAAILLTQSTGAMAPSDWSRRRDEVASRLGVIWWPPVGDLSAG